MCSEEFRGSLPSSDTRIRPTAAATLVKFTKVLEKFTKFTKFEKFEEFEEFEKIEKLNFLKCVDGGKRVDDW